MKSERFASSSLMTLVIAVAAIPSTAVASPTEARRLNSAADTEFEAALSYAGDDGPRAVAMMRHAAFLYWEAAQELPESVAHRGARSDLLGKTLSAYRQAQQIRPDRQNLEDSLRIVRSYCDTMRAVYGDHATELTEYEQAQSHLSTLTQELAAGSPPAPAVQPPSIAEAERSVGVPAGGEGPPPVAPSTPPIDKTRPNGARRLTIGLGVSAGLTGATALLALSTGLTLIRDPFRGARYRGIVDAVDAADIEVTPGGDLCAAGKAQDAAGVVSACAAYQSTRWASLAMGITAGVSAISTATFGVLLARARRAEARARRPHVALVPSRFGAEMRVAVEF